MRILSIAGALLVTFLWSSSYVLVKIGLQEIKPLSFAAARYVLAFLILLAGTSVRRSRVPSTGFTRRLWILLVIVGLAGYTLAQGFNFLGLFYLPATTTSFLLNFTPIFVVFMGIPLLREKPSGYQAAGITIAVIGAYLYFLVPITSNEVLGVVIVLLSGLGWASYMVLVRELQTRSKIDALTLTTTTMGIGSLALTLMALAIEGVPSITLQGWLTIAWLSFVNTALAFYLWNRVLGLMRAYELSVIQNTMLVQIALLSSIFLGETFTPLMLTGMGLVLAGVFIVQVMRPGDRTDRPVAAGHQLVSSA